MKYFILFFLLVNSIQIFAQTDKTIEHGGITREYLEYVPNIYDGTEAVPLMVCLHGLGDTKEGFFSIGMNHIADTANFIILTPEALDDVIFGQPTGTAWNSGASQYGIVINDDIDDVGFLTTIINDTKALYNIDESQVYIMGFSMGGFMSNKLACEMSGSIAAIASVSGTIGTALNCTPEFSIPVCHFHGTNDGTVAYTNNAYGNDPEELVEFWRAHNNCDISPVETSLPDIASDGRTVDYFYYGNGDDNTTVEFYKVNNGAHEWMYLPNFDISYGFEIWKFFRKHGSSNVGVDKVEMKDKFNIFPNPAQDYLTIELDINSKSEVNVIALDGRLIKAYSITDIKTILDISDISNGMYVISDGNFKKKLLINR